jgi:hypothetical protein
VSSPCHENDGPTCRGFSFMCVTAPLAMTYARRRRSCGDRNSVVVCLIRVAASRPKASFFYRSHRRGTVIYAAAAVRAHPRRVCEGDLPLFANSSRAERPAGSPTGIDAFERAIGGTAGRAATEGPPHTFSGVEGSGEPFADSSLSCFSAIGPKAINLLDTPAAGVCKPWPACEP